ncbi:MAG: hypothetical protein IPP15_16260 [Saprospiraceae bacterium]|uniref:Lipoprotein n=1 Tax=Candidatus Opimibacter skivensis TaxID=2982028 RepID=A0A9D7SXB8_9BACT|nr:hypothetical protein [Candidatus Opimibacter skivensis]
MKNFSVFLSMFSMVFLLSSCDTARIRHMSLAAREDSPEMFVQTKDMTIIPVTESTRKDYKDEDLIASQDKRSFNRIDGKKEYVRLIKGRMNLYYEFTDYLTTSFSTPNAMNPTGMSTHTRTHVSRFFDLGLDKPIIYFNRENLGNNTTGCRPCKNELALYDQKRKGLKWWKYANFASIAGSFVVGFSGPSEASKYTDLQIYGFPLLLFGGFGSEIYRVSRRQK